MADRATAADRREDSCTAGAKKFKMSCGLFVKCINIGQLSRRKGREGIAREAWAALSTMP